METLGLDMHVTFSSLCGRGAVSYSNLFFCHCTGIKIGAELRWTDKAGGDITKESDALCPSRH